MVQVVCPIGRFHSTPGFSTPRLETITHRHFLEESATKHLFSLFYAPCFERRRSLWCSACLHIHLQVQHLGLVDSGQWKSLLLVMGRDRIICPSRRTWSVSRIMRCTIMAMYQGSQ